MRGRRVRLLYRREKVSGMLCGIGVFSGGFRFQPITDVAIVISDSGNRAIAVICQARGGT